LGLQKFFIILPRSLTILGKAFNFGPRKKVFGTGILTIWKIWEVELSNFKPNNLEGIKVKERNFTEHWFFG